MQTREQFQQIATGFPFMRNVIKINPYEPVQLNQSELLTKLIGDNTRDQSTQKNK
jgi:hypothetical protein